MDYIEFTGTTYYDGLQGCKKPIPKAGNYRIVGKGKGEFYHLLMEGKGWGDRISIRKSQFEIVRIVREVGQE